MIKNFVAIFDIVKFIRKESAFIDTTKYMDELHQELKKAEKKSKAKKWNDVFTAGICKGNM